MQLRRPIVLVPLLAVAAALLAGSGSSTAARAHGAAVPAWHAWLCKPGQARDWCHVILTTTSIDAHGTPTSLDVKAAPAPKVDCFYVYPSVSQQHRGNSTLTPTAEEEAAAISEAAQFAQVCRGYAPMYRQVTAFGDGNPYHGIYHYEYDDVLAAWRDYMAHYNHGRGVILIGHSEGSFLLERIINEQIEPSASERKLLISALLLGGNVTVTNGKTTGGTFKTVPACTSRSETGCVVAYSSWDRTPPKDAGMERVDKPSQHVLCVNPAAPGSTAAVPVTPLFPGYDPQGLAPNIPSYITQQLWVEFPHLYTAQCVQQGTRAWLLVKRIPTAGDKRPTVVGVLSPSAGLHAADVSITLGTLVPLARTETQAWLAHH